MLPQIAPAIADALAQAKMVTFSSGDTGAPESTTNNITSVIQTVLAAQMVSRGLLDGQAPVPPALPPAPTAADAKLPTSLGSAGSTTKR
jgi:flotillin